MFQDAVSAGKHLICDFKNIKNDTILNDTARLQTLCREICAAHNFTILGELEKQFEPQGFSFIFLLSESHLSIHTFPERQHLSFDLYTCRQYDTNEVYLNIYKTISTHLESPNSEIRIIDRNF